MTKEEFKHNFKVTKELAEMQGLELVESNIYPGKYDVLNKAGKPMCFGGTLFATWKWLRERSGQSTIF